MCTNKNLRNFPDYMIEYARLFYALCPEHRTYNKARAEEKHGACKYYRRPACGERFAEEIEADGKAVGKPLCKLRGDSLRHLFHGAVHKKRAEERRRIAARHEERYVLHGCGKIADGDIRAYEKARHRAYYHV